MNFNDVIKTVAPWIGTALGGPLGGLAVQALGDALGVSEPTQDKIAAALKGATSEEFLAIKNADNEFSAKMKALGFEHETKLASISAENTNSARQMQINTKSWVPPVLALTIVGGFLALLIGLMFGVLKSSDSQALMFLLGSLGAAFNFVINFYFGSTAESGRKTTLISKAEPIRELDK
jgi:hypothetical protein